MFNFRLFFKATLETNNNMRTPYLLLILLVSNISLQAQNVIVKDANSHLPIANVYIFSECKTALTKSNGFADLNHFCADSIIIFQHAAYIDFVLNTNHLKNDSLFEVFLVPEVNTLDEVVVGATKWGESHREAPMLIDKINAKKASIYAPQTSADLLASSSNIFVQKSQLGGGSPMIRGFSANRVLLVVDGVRLNNAIYRGGNLQNILSIDVNAVDHVEVIYGPGSVIYGSDALGGVMNFSTIKPQFSDSIKPKAKIDGFLRYASANKEKTGSVSIQLNSKKWSSSTLVSHSIFDDLRMGSKGHPSYDRPNYVINYSGKDSVVTNRNRNIQVGSGYSQFNLLQKLAYKPSQYWRIDYNIYYSQTSDVPRYDRLIQTKNDQLTYAEWYYGPQKWFMNSLNILHDKKTKLYDQAKIILAYQNVQESRHKRKYFETTLNEQFEMVNMLSTDFDFFKKMGSKNTLYYGFEGVYNLVNSRAHDLNTIDNSRVDALTRYPDDAKYYSVAVYLSDKYHLTENLIANTGIRLNYTSVMASFDHSLMNFPYQTAESKNTALTGNLGLVYLPNFTSKVSLNLSSGYRAPNVDDLAKVFESGTGNVVVPNPNLKPEQVYSVDLTYEKQLWKRIHMVLNGFYSYLDNAMVVSDFTFNAQDSILFDGEMSKVEALTNKDYAHIYGVQASADLKIWKDIFIKTSINYTKGFDSQNYALRHVPPMFGATHLIFDNSRLIIDAYSNYNASILYGDLAQSEREKAYLYEQDSKGQPYALGWQTFNLKLTYRMNPYFYLTAGVENIFDTRYRPYSSGIAAPGRNIIVSIRMTSF